MNPVREKRCFLCEAVEQLHIHHLDLDHENDAPGNHAALCQRCHSAVHAYMGVMDWPELIGVADKARQMHPERFREEMREALEDRKRAASHTQ